MVRISSAEVRVNLSEVLNRAAYGKERIVLTRRGKELAAIVPIDDLELLEDIENQIDIEEIRKAWEEQGDEPLESLEKVKKDLGLK